MKQGNQNKRLALIAMAARPYHAGHESLIELASRECDEVNVFISNTDRGIIKGPVMNKIWNDLIVDSLDANVNVYYDEYSPLQQLYTVISVAENNDDITTTYVIYSDDKDIIANYKRESLLKAAPTLYEAGLIVLRPVKRAETVNISGTLMRKFIQNNDFNSFKRYAPKRFDPSVYWDALTKNVLN